MLIQCTLHYLTCNILSAGGRRLGFLVSAALTKLWNSADHLHKEIKQFIIIRSFFDTISKMLTGFVTVRRLQKVPYLFEYKSHFFVPKYRPKSQVRHIHEYMKCIVCDSKFFQGISLLSPFTQLR